MSNEVLSMLQDEREIVAVYFNEVNGSSFMVGGPSGVEKIVAYGEPGQMGYVPWIAVYKAGQIHCRFPADRVEIYYAKGA